MTGSVSGRYALRSLRRNLRRTLLSVIGVAIGAPLGSVFAKREGAETVLLAAAVLLVVLQRQRVGLHAELLVRC